MAGAMSGFIYAGPSAVLPDLPTIAEAGIPGYEMLNWLGLFAPAGTPAAIVERLSAETLRALGTPQVVKALHTRGAEPAPLAGREFAAFVKSEIEKWGKVVELHGEDVPDAIAWADAIDPHYAKLWLDFTYGGMFRRGILDERTRTLIVGGQLVAMDELETPATGAPQWLKSRYCCPQRSRRRT